MSPQRVKTYCWLFVAMSASVLANLLLFQASPDPKGRIAQADNRAYRVGAVMPASSVDQVVDTVRAIQRELKQLHLYPGQIDGKSTMLLHSAIMAWEQAQALPLTGEPSQSLLRDLIVGPSARGGSDGAAALGVVPGSPAEKLVIEIRQKLASIGYDVGGGDGRITRELIAGIRAFERDTSLPQTGRVGPVLVIQLQRAVTAHKSRAG